MNRVLLIGAALAAVVAAGYYTSPSAAPAPVPDVPSPCPGPGPCPTPKPKPRKPWGPQEAAGRAAPSPKSRTVGAAPPVQSLWRAYPFVTHKDGKFWCVLREQERPAYGPSDEKFKSHISAVRESGLRNGHTRAWLDHQLWLSGESDAENPSRRTPIPRDDELPKAWRHTPQRPAALGWREGGVLLPSSRWDASVGGPVAPDGTEIHCDYPGERHVRNTSSHGLGLCVFTSIHHAADWQNIPQLIDMPKWMIKSSIPGGGYPEKVKTLISRISKERGMPEPDYVQVEGPAAQVFPVLAEATKSGRMVCITYSHSPTGRYGGGSISHMVNLPHLDQANAAVLDNNYVGYDKFEWMTPRELERAAGGSRIWAIVFANPGPPPAPHDADVPPAPRTQIVRDDVPAPREPEKFRKACDCSERCTCGCNSGRPCRCADPAPVRRDPATTGVEWDKMAPDVRYHHKGYEVPLHDFLAAIPDDAKKYRAVVIGPRERIAQVEADWKAAPQDVKDSYVLQTYEPTHWHVQNLGFALDKDPAVHVLKPDGTLVDYQEGYDRGRFVAALRRKSPNFKPQPPSPLPGLPANLPLVPAAVVGGLGLGAYLVLRKKST